MALQHEMDILFMEGKRRFQIIFNFSDVLSHSMIDLVIF